MKAWHGWLAALLLAVAACPAQAARVAVRGVVDTIDPATGVVTLRTAGGGRQNVIVVGDAELTIGGRSGVLGEIMVAARTHMLAWRGVDGQLYADVVRVNQPAIPTRLAAMPPGAVTDGIVAGLFPNQGVVVLQTRTGYRNVTLGTAPIIMQGRPITIFDLAIGDRLQVQRQATLGGIELVPSLAVVSTGERVAGTRQTFRAPMGQAQQILPGQTAPTGTTAAGRP